jgi:hypothetical protein
LAWLISEDAACSSDSFVTRHKNSAWRGVLGRRLQQRCSVDRSSLRKVFKLGYTHLPLGLGLRGFRGVRPDSVFTNFRGSAIESFLDVL